jgi:hypothetical protein
VLVRRFAQVRGDIFGEHHRYVQSTYACFRIILHRVPAEVLCDPWHPLHAVPEASLQRLRILVPGHITRRIAEYTTFQRYTAADLERLVL